MRTLPSVTVPSYEPASGVSRRTVLRGAAYVAPAVAVLSLTATSAEAASAGPGPGPGPDGGGGPGGPGSGAGGTGTGTGTDGAVLGGSTTAGGTSTGGTTSVSGTGGTAQAPAGDLPFTGTSALTVAVAGAAVVAAGVATPRAGRTQREGDAPQ